MLRKCKHWLLFHNATEAVIIAILQCSGAGEPLSQKGRRARLVTDISWSREMQHAPFSSIIPLRQQLLRFSLDTPGLYAPLALSLCFEASHFEVPIDLITTITADPLSVEINI